MLTPRRLWRLQASPLKRNREFHAEVVGWLEARLVPRDCQPVYRVKQPFLWLPLHLRGQAQSSLQIPDFNWGGARQRKVGTTLHPHSFLGKAVVVEVHQLEEQGGWRCLRTSRSR